MFLRLSWSVTWICWLHRLRRASNRPGFGDHRTSNRDSTWGKDLVTSEILSNLPEGHRSRAYACTNFVRQLKYFWGPHVLLLERAYNKRSIENVGRSNLNSTNADHSDPGSTGKRSPKLSMWTRTCKLCKRTHTHGRSWCLQACAHTCIWPSTVSQPSSGRPRVKRLGICNIFLTANR